MKIEDIDSIGWLYAVNGNITLVACTADNAHGFKLLVSGAQFKETEGDKEKMKRLFIETLESRRDKLREFGFKFPGDDRRKFSIPYEEKDRALAIGFLNGFKFAGAKVVFFEKGKGIQEKCDGTLDGELSPAMLTALDEHNITLLPV